MSQSNPAIHDRFQDPKDRIVRVVGVKNSTTVTVKNEKTGRHSHILKKTLRHNWKLVIFGGTYADMMNTIPVENIVPVSRAEFDSLSRRVEALERSVR